MSTVAPLPPEDEEDVFHGGEVAGVAVTPILLGLTVLRGGTAIEPLEHVALLEGVVDHHLVVGTWLLQHVVENPSCLLVLSLLAPLVLLMGLLGLAALRECVVHALALLAFEDRPHGLFA
jgi:hypothetical protein